MEDSKKSSLPYSIQPNILNKASFNGLSEGTKPTHEPHPLDGLQFVINPKLEAYDKVVNNPELKKLIERVKERDESLHKTVSEKYKFDEDHVQKIMDNMEASLKKIRGQT